MTTTAQPDTKPGTSRAYWTHKVESFPSPVAQFRMAQLIDLDERLYETARIVYRFMVGWYHDEHGDALLSQRHVAKVMKQRAPEGAAVPSRNAVQRAIIALMETGWVVRSFQGRGKGKGASRYVPVMNVLELASQGHFPELAHSTGPVDDGDELARANGPLVAHANGPVGAELAHAIGPKTLLLDPATEPGTSIVGTTVSAHADAALRGAAAREGFERIWSAYGKLGNKQASRAVFEAIADPDVDQIAERASAWAASAKPGQKRMPLEKWLAQERYDEADRKVVAAPAPAVNDNAKPATAKKPREPFVEQRETLRITSAELSPDERYPGDTWLLMHLFREEDGYTLEPEAFIVESSDREEQEDGQRDFQRFLDKIGADRIDEPDDLVGHRYVRILRSEFGEYEYERPSGKEAAA